VTTTLVTGGAGYIGSHMVLSLRDAGRQVVVFDDLSTGHRDAVPPDVPFVEGDVGDVALVARTLKRHQVSTVVHFAGSISVEESVRAPLDYYTNNVANTCALIKACVEAGRPRVVMSSTAAVYGMPDVLPTAEDAPLRPISPYGASKMMSERILTDAAAAHGFGYVILRYFNVGGADPELRAGQRSREATHLIKMGLLAALGLRPGVTVFGETYPTRDGTAVRDYVHVCDVAGAHMRAITHLEAGGDSLVLNCGYGRGFTVREVLETLQAETGSRFPITQGPARAGDPPELVADTRQLTERLGWRPQHADLGEIIRTAWAYELQSQGALRKAAPALGQER
jgi:UDP-glucose 4-epimerase